MSSNVIEMRDVYKSFGKHQVLSGLNLRVPESSVFAFLGNNGEGKSTAIRMMLGLLEFDRGTVDIFGLGIKHKRSQILQNIGCLVDSPSAYPNLRAHEFLEISCLLKKLPKAEIERCLGLVGLRDVKRTLIAQYSLGMKQRLALAHALMGNPKLLILDEPTNGLDPSGIQEIRSLIASLPRETGATVFISSHQLDEVEKIASHIALLRDGRVHFEAKLDEFRNLQKNEFVVEVDDISLATQVLRGHGFETQIVNEKELFVSEVLPGESWRINQILVETGVRLFASSFTRLSLEQWFAREISIVEGKHKC